MERALNDEERSRFVVIYGRRRLGKSTLIRHILRDTDVYYMADMTEQSQQIAMLSKIIAYKFEGFDQVIYPDWDSLIVSLKHRTTERFTLCLDEFPYIQVSSIDILDKRIDLLSDLSNGGIDALSVEKADLCEQPYPDKSFDVVTLLEVLEHIPNVEKAIASAVRMAKSYVVVTVPSKEDDNPEHIHLLTKDKLTSYFNACGVKKLSFDGETGPYVQYTHARCCSVLRKGKYIGTVDIKDTNKQELSNMMVGRPVQLQVQKEEAKPTDVGLLNGQLFLNEIGTGFDVAVLDYAQKAKKYCRGLLPYLFGVLRALFTFRPIPVTYKIDDQEAEKKDVFVIAAANGGIIGGGIVIAPDARVDDGLLDIVIVDRIKWYKLPLRLIGLLRGNILRFPETHFLRAKEIRFSAPDMRLNVDGEIVSAQAAQAKVLPGALKIHR